jgi:tRNA-dihydrouridine synthase
MVTLHGRTRVQNTRAGRLEPCQGNKEAVSIPLRGSGDILTPADAIQRFEETGCDAVHIGRGAIANPFIFRQTWEVMEGLEPYEPSPDELHTILIDYLGYLRELCLSVE